MENTLIIKTGATGDVVRTTSLLNSLQGNIYWVTAKESKPILPDDIPGLNILSDEDDPGFLKNIPFKQILSFEEDVTCAKLASEVQAGQLTGVYLDKGRISYTDNSAHWFDMSRISKFGLQKANTLKAANTRTYQDHIFQMIGKKFNGEPYRVFGNDQVKQGTLIGIEKRAGKQWPDKQWWGYDELVSKLEANGYPVKILEQRNDIRTYLDDIARCSHIVSGDTLAMHVALAYGKTCTSIFNCTSPQEIYDYGLMKKVISPLLGKYFYATSFDKEVIESISLDEVYDTLPL